MNNKNLDSTPNPQADVRYWKSLEEWAGDTSVQDMKSVEFMSSPLESADEQSPEHHLARREFFQIMSAGLALAATGCTRRPVEKIVPYLNQPAEVNPGIANWYASTCTECSENCGVVVKTREGKPIKFEGNAEHPLSRGGLCARGQASVLNVYDPDRLQAPLFVDRTSQSSTTKSWADFDNAVVAEIKKVKEKSGRIRFLSGELNGSSAKLVKDFIGNIPGAQHVVYEPLAEEETALAQELSYGNRVLPRYRLEKARYILSFGADFLGTWGHSVENSKAFSMARKLESGKMARLAVIEPIMSLTGTNADVRWAVSPGQQLRVALGIAHEIIVAQKATRFSSDAGINNLLANYTLSKVAQDTGLPHEGLRKVARDLIAAKGASVVFGGGHQVKGDVGLALEVVVNLLNSALDNEGATVDGAVSPAPVSTSFTAFSKLLNEMKSGQIDLLFIEGLNPVYTAQALGFVEAMNKVPVVISFSESFDETAARSTHVASTSHSLESWSDANANSGVYSLVQPTIHPLYETRAFQESLFSWAKSLGWGGAFASNATWYDYLRAQWQVVQREVGASGSFASFWEKSLKEGVVFSTSAINGAGRARTYKAASLDLVASAVPTVSKDLKLVLYPKMGLAEGARSNNSWLQELPDPVTKVTWDNYASMSLSTAQAKGLKEGDVVRIKAGSTSVEVPVHIQPGNHSDVVGIALGYGRTRAGRVGNKVGKDVYPFVAAGKSMAVLSGTVVTLEKTGAVRRLAATQQHHSAEGRPIIKEATFEEFKKDPKAGNEEQEELTTLWSGHKYEGHRWAMSIDLSACTGCGACVIGCQAENNIPVVGYKDVLNGREMHWIRIDRYYSGSPENPETVFQPMLCQQCENAPCETVCPVLATTHDNEGLNQQTYNRCVGTRYCANNCPYKVRRFNWYTYTDLAKPLNFQYNPDVTVRTRGVMEKCTFCTQRIRDAKGRAKDMNRKVKDGEIVTACQQSCPTDAIVFGDINDKTSRIHQIAMNSPRGYRVLEELNTRPSITYLTKIRNREE